MSFFEKLFGTFSDKELKRIRPLADKVLALEPEMQQLTDEQLQAKTGEFKDRLAKGETLDDLLHFDQRAVGLPVPPKTAAEKYPIPRFVNLSDICIGKEKRNPRWTNIFGM